MILFWFFLFMCMHILFTLLHTSLQYNLYFHSSFNSMQQNVYGNKKTKTKKYEYLFITTFSQLVCVFSDYLMHIYMNYIQEIGDLMHRFIIVDGKIFSWRIYNIIMESNIYYFMALIFWLLPQFHVMKVYFGCKWCNIL